MTLFMHALQPDLGKLMRFATRERLLPPGGDLGYTLHAALSSAFGELAPKPFLWCAPGTRSGGAAGRLLCYSPTSLSSLIAHAESFAEPTGLALLDVKSAESKPMPSAFAEGSRLGFQVRIRPVLRTGRERDGTGGKERDAYIDGTTGTEHRDGRDQCYLHWLRERLAAGGVQVDRATVESFTLTRLMTRDRSADKSRRDAPQGPDAVARGTLVVNDPDAFAALLARGVGRFRAFGFGMLLLAPPARANQ
ncbi:MAG: type I-E CRISPR-associated protein Cas6/Cse3/CasE [bacterium]